MARGRQRARKDGRVVGGHQKHRIQRNSSNSFKAGRKQRANREAQIIAVYRASAVPLRDREVGEQLGYADLNGVRPTITGLIAKRVLKKAGDMTCPETGRTVRIVALVDREDKRGCLFAMKKGRAARLRSERNVSK